MERQEDKVLQYMKNYGGITSLEMFDKFYICSPQAVIRNIRTRYTVLDEWIEKKKKYIDDKGKEKYKVVRFKRWYLAG